MLPTKSPETPKVPERETDEWKARVQRDAIGAHGEVAANTTFTPRNPHDVQFTSHEEAQIVGQARKNSPATKTGT